MSEPAISVSYTVNARSLNTNVVTNYDNTALAYNVVLPLYHAENNNDGVDLAGRFTIASGQWSSGVMAFNSNIARFDRLMSPDGPYSSLQLGVQISEPDGADFATLDFKPADTNDCVADGDCTGVAIGGLLKLRFGRMKMKDGFGPELAAIPMFWQTEYWDGSSFVINSDDHCTQLAISDVTFSGATTSINAPADTITVTVGGVSSDFNFADPIGGSDCMSPLNISFCDGQAGVAYGAPGSVVTYPISVDLTNLPQLQFDWNQDGTFDDAALPSVNINFQSYRGNDRVIYWQETFQ
jgi:MSHA biogenesis protein MshQ